VVEKVADGKESLKITIRAPTLKGGGGQARPKIAEEITKQPKAQQSIRLVHTTNQTGFVEGHPAPSVKPIPHTG
jgi:hypothetical protein